MCLVTYWALLGLLLATASGQYIELFGTPWRNVSNLIQPNTIMQWLNMNPSLMAMSYMGYAQIRSATPLLPNPILFTTHPATGGWTSALLPRVQINSNGQLCCWVSTLSGNDLYCGDFVPFDQWFAFGIALQNGSSRSLLIWISALDGSVPSATQFAMRADMVTSASAVTELKAVALPVTTSPAPRLYLMALRVFPWMLAVDDFAYYLANYPPGPYAVQYGAQVGVIGAEQRRSTANATCADPNGVFVSFEVAQWGRPIGLWPFLDQNPDCYTELATLLVQLNKWCLRRHTCIVPQSGGGWGAQPCPGFVNFVGVGMTCAPLSTTRLASPTTVAPSRGLSSALTATKSSPIGSVSLSWASNGTPGSTNSSEGGRNDTSMAVSRSGSNASRSSPSISWKAWRISLSLNLRSTSWSADDAQLQLSVLVADLSAALAAPAARFIRAQYAPDLSAPVTRIAFIVLPNATDPDATRLVDQFQDQIQLNGSRLRTGALLSKSGAPPVPIAVVGVRVVRCPDDQYAVPPEPCPTTTASATASAPPVVVSRSGAQLVGVVLAPAAAAVVVVAALCWLLCTCRRRSSSAVIGDPMRLPSSEPATQLVTTAVTMPLSTAATSLGLGSGDWPHGAGRASTTPTFGTDLVLPPPQRLNESMTNDTMTRLNKSRIERLQYGARDKFGQGAHTVDSQFSTLS